MRFEHRIRSFEMEGSKEQVDECGPVYVVAYVVPWPAHRLRRLNELE